MIECFFSRTNNRAASGFSQATETLENAAKFRDETHCNAKAISDSQLCPLKVIFKVAFLYIKKL
jgi:hypothetical protein